MKYLLFVCGDYSSSQVRRKHCSEKFLAAVQTSRILHEFDLVSLGDTPRISVDNSNFHYWEAALLLCPQSNTRCMKVNICSQISLIGCLDKLSCRFLVWLSVFRLLFGKRERYSQNCRGSTQFLFTSLWKLRSITCMNFLSSIDRPTLLLPCFTHVCLSQS